MPRRGNVIKPTENENEQPEIRPAGIYIFLKSGNEVKAIAPATPYRGQQMWTVERISGQSAGKQMNVPARALVQKEES